LWLNFRSNYQKKIQTVYEKLCRAVFYETSVFSTSVEDEVAKLGSRFFAGNHARLHALSENISIK